MSPIPSVSSGPGKSSFPVQQSQPLFRGYHLIPSVCHRARRHVPPAGRQFICCASPSFDSFADEDEQGDPQRQSSSKLSAASTQAVLPKLGPPLWISVFCLLPVITWSAAWKVKVLRCLPVLACVRQPIIDVSRFNVSCHHAGFTL